MTNPDNIVRVRARTGGRASVYEANGWAQGFTSGLLEGNGVTQNTSADMNVLVGGSSSKPDVVLAENPSGYRVALDIIGQQAVAITAPASNKRISAIVAYTDDLSLQSTEDTVTGSPASCGLIVVNGTAAANPSEPTDAQIRTAITSDGATGSQACYCVIATIEVANDTTIITDSLITINNCSLAGTGVVKSNNIDFTTITGSQLSSILSRASADNSVAMVANTTYTFNFDGFVYFRATFNSTNGYVRFQIKDENSNIIFEYQQNSGPKADYRHLTPIYPIKKGWKYVGDSSDTGFINNIVMLPVPIS